MGKVNEMDKSEQLERLHHMIRSLVDLYHNVATNQSHVEYIDVDHVYDDHDVPMTTLSIEWYGQPELYPTSKPP